MIRSAFLQLRTALAIACGSLWVATSFVMAQTPADYAVRLSATVVTNPPQITLSWPADPRATGYTLYRKTLAATSWGSPVTLATNATNYADPNVAVGSTYEYQITKTATNFKGFGYICAGIEAPLVESRGKVVLVVDSTHAGTLALELARLQQDLVGDGWTVLRHDVAPTSSVPSVKALIATDYNADRGNVKAVFLLGHVPVPYSGNINPDGHSDHKGAWPADVFYGEMNGTWTDSTVSNVVASGTRNDNVPGDGKYDLGTLPSDVELQVGRVDLGNLPAFSLGESELMRRYLNKDHHFRHQRLTVDPRGLVDDHFGTFDGEAFAVNGWRNFAPCFGASNTFAGDWQTTLATNSYLWGYGCGPGNYTSAAGVVSTSDLAASDPRVVFTMMFGSYFGDWDSPNNLLRASLATPTYTLTCAWAGRPHWICHPMALGETIGFCTRLTQNNSSLYEASYCTRWTHIALMGDPTLRMHGVAPPSALVLEANNPGGFDLRWQAPPEPVLGYAVYRGATAAGPFTRLNPELVASTNYTDAVSASNVCYMVRAVKLEVSASGSYYNASQGIFQDSKGTFNPPALSIRRATSSVVLSWSATFVALDYRLEAVPSLSAPNWSSVTNAVQTSNSVNSVTVDATGSGRFFRLAQP